MWIERRACVCVCVWVCKHDPPQKSFVAHKLLKCMIYLEKRRKFRIWFCQLRDCFRGDIASKNQKNKKHAKSTRIVCKKTKNKHRSIYGKRMILNIGGGRSYTRVCRECKAFSSQQPEKGKKEVLIQQTTRVTHLRTTYARTRAHGHTYVLEENGANVRNVGAIERSIVSLVHICAHSRTHNTSHNTTHTHAHAHKRIATQRA